ncbi:MAG TPA: hypothetical protein DCR55_04435 [Lentisphaeria bacterium]|nr:hypothetical protein [Lentisphaeria bacterium]
MAQARVIGRTGVSEHTLKARLRGWLELLRPPNLFSVPGDPIIGALATGYVGSLSVLLPPVITVLLGYAYGLVLNDVVDYKVDSAERPERPIPSGRVPIWAAILLAISLAAAALAVSWEWAEFVLALLALITAYNLLKHVPHLGEILMALTRVGSVVLGFVVCWEAVPAYDILEAGNFLLAITAVFAYIFILSGIARNEMQSLPSRGLIWCLRILPIVTCAGLFLYGSPLFMPLGSLWLYYFWGTCNRLARATECCQVPPLIGRLIRCYILMQAAMIAGLGSFYLGLGVALLAIGATIVGRKFYAS